MNHINTAPMNSRPDAPAPEMGPGTITPRCLATIPADLEAILAAFGKQISQEQR
jgi:hypothetical protein